jgi:hypothetical protein
MDEGYAVAMMVAGGLLATAAFIGARGYLPMVAPATEPVAPPFGPYMTDGELVTLAQQAIYYARSDPRVAIREAWAPVGVIADRTTWWRHGALYHDEKED